MKLYQINNEQLSSISSNPFNLEKEIQTLIENNVKELFDLEEEKWEEGSRQTQRCAQEESSRKNGCTVQTTQRRPSSNSPQLDYKRKEEENSETISNK